MSAAAPRPRILVVEDDPAVRRSIVGALQDAGYIVSQASDGMTALGECRLRDPAVIVLDLALPGMDGKEFLEAVLSAVARRAQ